MYEHVKNKFNFKKIKRVEMDIVAYAYNPTTEEAEAEGSFSTEQNKTDQIVSEDAFSALQLLLLS